eukprot:13991794-Alexandrium_andersonii.AAC.1
MFTWQSACAALPRAPQLAWAGGGREGPVYCTIAHRAQGPGLGPLNVFNDAVHVERVPAPGPFSKVLPRLEIIKADGTPFAYFMLEGHSSLHEVRGERF